MGQLLFLGQVLQVLLLNNYQDLIHHSTDMKKKYQLLPGVQPLELPPRALPLPRAASKVKNIVSVIIGYIGLTTLDTLSPKYS